MAKRPQRTSEQQEYRDNLAHDIKNLRQYGDTWKDLAKTLLEKEQETSLYQDSETRILRDKEINREKRNKRIIEIIDTKDFNKVKMYIERTSDFRLDVDVAKRLIKEGWGKLIYQNSEKFRPSDEMIELFLSLNIRDHMDRPDMQWIVNYIYHMKWWLNKEMVEKLIETKWLKKIAILDNLHKFEWLDKEVLFKLIDLGFSIDEYETLSLKLKYFSWLDKETAFLFISDWNYTWKEYRKKILAENIKMFEWLDWEVANKLVEDWYSKYVAENLESFEWVLDEDIAKKLTEEWYWKYVAKYPEKFWLKKEK